MAAADRPIALVTGATDGVGRAAAMALVKRGYEVCILGRNPERVTATLAELASADSSAKVTGIVADLSSLAQTRRACDEFMSAHDRLDLLVLNANAIAQERTITDEGYEFNIAIGFLSRATMTMALDPVLRAAPKAVVFTVVGLNLDRLDFDDPTMERGFSGQHALGVWQWAMQEWCREYNARGGVPMNVFMPGLVRTKILADEPGRLQRALIKVALVFVGKTPEKSASELMASIDDAVATSARDVYYSGGKPKGHRALKDEPGDGQKVWDLAAPCLRQDS